MGMVNRLLKNETDWKRGAAQLASDTKGALPFPRTGDKNSDKPWPDRITFT